MKSRFQIPVLQVSKDGTQLQTHCQLGKKLSQQANLSKIVNFLAGVLCTIHKLLLATLVEQYKDGQDKLQDGLDPLKLINKKRIIKELLHLFGASLVGHVQKESPREALVIVGSLLQQVPSLSNQRESKELFIIPNIAKMAPSDFISGVRRNGMESISMIHFQLTMVGIMF